jgi:23S rRNA (pseudouridine1915-N3)-methyltransferase
MHFIILVIGKPALPWAKAGAEDYLHRLRRYGRVELECLREGTPAQNAERLLKASEGCHRVVMDERGRRPDTMEARAAVDRWEMDAGIKRVAFLIGGADGHPPGLRAAAQEVWALSALTLQHELALVVLLEQIYRVQTIRRGEPYHRV